MSKARGMFLVVMFASLVVWGCSGKSRNEETTNANTATIEDRSTNCACQADKKHRHADTTVTVKRIANKPGPGYHFGTDPEEVRLCTHKTATNGAQPDKVTWMSSFSGDTCVVLHFWPEIPFQGEDSLIIFKGKSHVSRLNANIGTVKVKGWVTLRDGKNCDHPVLESREKSTTTLRIMQGPGVITDD